MEAIIDPDNDAIIKVEVEGLPDFMKYDTEQNRIVCVMHKMTKTEKH